MGRRKRFYRLTGTITKAGRKFYVFVAPIRGDSRVDQVTIEVDMFWGEGVPL